MTPRGSLAVEVMPAAADRSISCPSRRSRVSSFFAVITQRIAA